MGALGQQLNERVSSNCAMRCRAAAVRRRRRGGVAMLVGCCKEALTCRTHDTSARTIAGAFSSLTEFLQLDFPSRNSVISEKKCILACPFFPFCWTVSMNIEASGEPETTTNDPPNEPVIKKKPLLLSNRLSNQPLRQGQAAAHVAGRLP